MRDENILLTDRARALLLAFAISQNASDFCRFVTVVALRDCQAISAVMVRVEYQNRLRSVGAYGQLKPEAGESDRDRHQLELLSAAIEQKQLVEVDQLAGSSDQSFIAIPFSPNGEALGALGVTFRNSPTRPRFPKAEVELLQLLSELIAVNSLPKMRAAGLLANNFYSSDELEWATALTARQLQVLDEMAIGKTNSQIAKAINVSESTVKQEAVRLFKLLGVNTRQKAVAVGKEMGII
jgi:ATP/maltotriose-dependent transcriptional regulator MalT